MTNLVPRIDATTLGTVVLRPLPDVEPFSIRSGYSFEGILSDIRTWLRDELVPYLEDNSAASIFQENVDTMIDTVNDALATQSGVVVAALNAAVQQVITAQVPVVDPIVLGVLNAVASQTRDWLTAHFADGVTAPAPRGAGLDDTAALMAVIAPVHAIGGTVHLRAGTYLCNLDLPAQFAQVKLVGKGMRATILKGFASGKSVIRFNGGSGQFGGGGLYECGIKNGDTSNNDIALVFSGTTGCKARAVQISGAFAEGVRFWNQRGSAGSGDFTEFNTFEGDISGCKVPVRYQTDNGVESFHGSGLVGDTTINIPGDKTGAIISISDGALPYNAPMSFTTWFHSGADAFLFDCGALAAGRHRSFYGHIRCEANNGIGNSLMGRGSNSVLFNGQISWLGCGSSRLGNIYLCRKIGYEGGLVWGDLEPISSAANLKNTPTIIATDFEADSLSLVAVRVTGANYEFHALLAVQRSKFDSSQAFITEITRTQDLDSAGKGDPQFYFNSALYCANGNFDTSFKAYVTVTNMGGSEGHNLLTQRNYV